MSRRWVGNLSLMLAGGLIGLLILEGGLRLAGISYPYFYIADPIVGYAHKPNAEGWWKKEGLAYIRINSAGFRDREHKKDKSPGTFRIAILGDSYTEALQVPIEQTYWTYMEEHLQRCPSLAGRQIEVLNLGVSGYGTAQEFLMLQHRGWEYSPDLVILAFLTGNDIRNNSRALQNDSTRPYFIDQDDRLILDASFRDSLAFHVRSLEFSQQLFEHLRVLQVLREAEYKIKAHVADQNHRDKVSAAVGSAIGPDQMEYLEPQERLWAQAWEVTEKLIVQTRDEVRRNGAEFLLVILSNPDQVHPDPRHRQELAAKLGVQDLLYPDRRIVSWAKRHDIPVLSLVQPMAAYAEEHRVFLHGFSNATIGDGHWNAEGHRVAGDLIVQKVCSMPRQR